MFYRAGVRQRRRRRRCENQRRIYYAIRSSIVPELLFPPFLIFTSLRFFDSPIKVYAQIDGVRRISRLMQFSPVLYSGTCIYKPVVVHDISAITYTYTCILFIAGMFRCTLHIIIFPVLYFTVLNALKIMP